MCIKWSKTTKIPFLVTKRDQKFNLRKFSDPPPPNCGQFDLLLLSQNHFLRMVWISCFQALFGAFFLEWNNFSCHFDANNMRSFWSTSSHFRLFFCNNENIENVVNFGNLKQRELEWIAPLIGDGSLCTKFRSIFNTAEKFRYRISFQGWLPNRGVKAVAE